MQLSVKAEPIFYSLIKELGFDGIDLSMHGSAMREAVLAPEYCREVLEQGNSIQRAGLRVSQTHLGFHPAHIPVPGDGSYRIFEELMLPIFLKQIELSAKIGAGVCVIHLYLSADRAICREANLSLLEKLLPTAERCGITLAIENIFDRGLTDGGLSTAEDLLFFVEKLRSPNLGICLDTGHAVGLGQDPVEMLRRIGGHLSALHVHSTTVKKDLHAIPYSLGTTDPIDWNAFAKCLREIGYKGSFNLEIKLRLGADNPCTDTIAAAYYRFARDVARAITTCV